MNAKKELLKQIANTAKIKCAFIEYDISDSWDDGDFIKFILKVNYTEKEYNEFLTKLDFEYSQGYGMQYLYGIVWLEDGTWLSRGEYDGSEWWNHNKLPDIPSECL